MKNYSLIQPGSFDPVNHWYQKALNAVIHPMVDFFLHMSKERIVERYCHLRPKVNRDFLLEILSTKPKHFRWAGADLINVTTEQGKRQMVVIETIPALRARSPCPAEMTTMNLGPIANSSNIPFCPCCVASAW
ncbi:MAG: hypothetical protein R3B47_02535 [Bacteroidia bacterium]